MNKAFIFDMDGVIINSEPVWEKSEEKFFTNLLGEKNFFKIKRNILGSTTDTIYDFACQAGLRMRKNQFMQKYDELAVEVYAKSKLTKDVDLLIETLLDLDFKLGLLSASRPFWIEQVLPKLKNKDVFLSILSLANRNDLRPRPFADGYLEIINKLESTPKKTMILEDSNKGITAAKASGALTICLKENLPKDYESKGADLYMNNLQEVITFIKIYE